jgi:excisionase family DNA binding protein
VAAQIPTLDEIETLVRRLLEEHLGQAAAPADVLTTEQAAEAAGVTAKTIREWVAGGLPATRRGRRIVLLRSDVEAWQRGELRRGADIGADLARGR